MCEVWQHSVSEACNQSTSQGNTSKKNFFFFCHFQRAEQTQTEVHEETGEMPEIYKWKETDKEKQR